MSNDDRYPEFRQIDRVPGTNAMSLLVTTAAAAAALAVGINGVVLALPPDVVVKRATLVASNPDRIRQASEQSVLKKTPEVGLERTATKAEFEWAFVSAKDRLQHGSAAYVAALVSVRGELSGLPFL